MATFSPRSPSSTSYSHPHAGMHEVALLTEVVGVDEHVLAARVGCDEPVTAHLVEPQNPACLHHDHHHPSNRPASAGPALRA